MRLQWFQNQKFYLLIGIAIVAVCIFLLINQSNKNDLVLIEPEQTESILKEKQPLLEDEEHVEVDKPVMIKIDVKGAVKRPGVYSVTDSDRVIDVIELAGGITEDADLKPINLSAKVFDEMVIYVPKVGEKTEEILLPPQKNTSSTGGKERSLVNINLADSTELQTLPGVGSSKALAIIEYRELNGPFEKIEDLKNVTGIGEKTYEKLANLITVK